MTPSQASTSKRRLPGMAAVLLLALTAVGGAPGEAASSPLPAGCALPEVRGAFDRLFRAAAASDHAAVDSLIAPPAEQIKGGPKPVFQIGVESHRGRHRRVLASNAPGKLFGFFESRSAERRFSLLSASVSSGNSGEGGPTAEIAFEIALRGGGYPVRQAGGKGGLNCESAQFSLWQMGIGQAERRGSSCGGTEVDARRPPKNPIMCQARGRE